MKAQDEFQFKTIIEPFRIKVVEPIPMLSPQERKAAMERAFYNLFFLKSHQVTFDLLTDSGTSAMSSNQWAGIMIGDESYAGSSSFLRFERVVQDLTGMEFVIPTHQGRAAEHLLMQALVQPGMQVLGNTHFDTTRANIEVAGAEAVDLPVSASKDSRVYAPFKGNLDIEGLKSYLKNHSSKVPLVILTVTNNSVGGQPVSMSNIAAVKEALAPYGIPLFLDAARFAENAYFIKLREAGFENQTVKQIAKQMFSYADGVLMSAKKDAFGNMGGFLCTRNERLAQTLRTLMVVTEGFPTYGGLSGRDLEALAVGLEEIVDESYLSYRIRSVSYFGEGIKNAGFVTVEPFGGHAVYIDAGASLPHIPPAHYPGQALSIALYEHIGIRSVEVGSVMLGKRDSKTLAEIPAPLELIRLAMPRRAYTQSHVDYMIEGIEQLKARAEQLGGFRIVEQAPVLRHFTAKFARR